MSNAAEHSASAATVAATIVSTNAVSWTWTLSDSAQTSTIVLSTVSAIWVLVQTAKFTRAWWNESVKREVEKQTKPGDLGGV